ncbi:1-acyl-sn-glycerol-3-phosphate acyltransferase [uncultured Duncaniella sp.]|uniref:1-acyl-sn-glycerol-3-phosphate acyltransferase n=1 Tax=uncultured Duncaniella sp. TaxID=2768039 RepID=UPI0025D4CE85|nr:1-acyl-sn-glycerol-3-phosphate acyltransferase [uncultured Duncaniella sp.]
MGFCKSVLKLFGWRVLCTVPDYPKSIVCVAPHTSNWDFVLGEFAYWSLGRKAGFLMKESWFFFPMKYLFRALGGIPVSRKRGGHSLTDVIIHKFNESSRLCLAITPEGTRSLVTEWHTGFLHIAYEAGIPIVLGAIDASRRLVHLEKTFIPTGDIQADMRAVKDYYRRFKGIRPGKFSAE